MHCDRLGLGHTLSIHCVVTMTTTTTFLQFEVVNSVIYSCKLNLSIYIFVELKSSVRKLLLQFAHD